MTAERSGLLATLVELVLPRLCVGCGADGKRWCRDCIEAEFDPVLHRPDPCPAGLPITAAAAPYAGSVRTAVLAAKERDRRDLDRPLGSLLASAVAVHLAPGRARIGAPGPLWLVPVPAGPRVRRERGRDQVQDWARWATRSLAAADVPAQLVPALRRLPGGLDSVGLAATARANNLHGAFTLGRVSAPAPGTIIVLVDDIVTTGATLVAASASLRSGFGLPEGRIRAAVVAATQRRPRVDDEGDVLEKTGRSLAEPGGNN